jgi:GntR family transcriptional repressor for pyruvate dehydrogenase complex
MFRKIAHDRTADTVMRQIEDLVLDGVLRPGDRLPAERELSAELDVSRPILRAALKELEARHLVASRPGEGTYVAEILGTVFKEPMVGLVRRHPRAIADYLEFRREVEGLASAFAAERATAADLAILDRILAAMAEAHAAADPAAESRLDVEFHMAIVEAAHNIVLLHTMRSSYQLMAEGVFHNRDRLYAHAPYRLSLLEQHRGIHAAIAAGNTDAARRAAEDHIAFVERALKAVGETLSREANAARRLAKYERAAARTLAS